MLEFLFGGWGYMQGIRRFSEVRQTVAGAVQVIGEAEIRIPELEATRDRLQLVCQAMWELLRDKHGLTDEGLVERVREIDLRDGQLDGKVTPTEVARCSSCRRVVNRRHRICIYCGAHNSHSAAFETI